MSATEIEQDRFEQLELALEAGSEPQPMIVEASQGDGKAQAIRRNPPLSAVVASGQSAAWSERTPRYAHPKVPLGPGATMAQLNELVMADEG